MTLKLRSIFTFILITSFSVALILSKFFNLAMALLGVLLVVVATILRHFNRSITTTTHSDPNCNFSEVFVSIHIPAYKEPVDTLRKTIEAAALQNYKNYEVLVIYNNTSDSSYWQPIEAYCEKFENVKFLNFPKIKFYKAGALNKALDYVHINTDYILTVDADYILSENALNIAVNDILTEKVSLLQYPQSYHNLSSRSGISVDFKHYFTFYSERASEHYLNLPTGTLTLIKYNDLKKIGNWPVFSITEDAQLGLELINAGFKIGFKNREIGKGLAPLNSVDLGIQRKRWIFGNIQNIFSLFKKKKIIGVDKIFLLGQLTSWINFLIIPYLVIITSAIGNYFFSNVLYSKESVLLSLYAIAISHISKIIIFLKASGDLKLGWAGFIAHCGLSYHSTVYWLSYFFNPIKPFIRTSKVYREGHYCTANYWLIVPLLFSSFYLNHSIGIAYSLPVLLHAFFLIYCTHKINTDLKIEFERNKNFKPITL